MIEILVLMDCHSHVSVGEVGVIVVAWLEHDIGEVHLVVLLQVDGTRPQ